MPKVNPKRYRTRDVAAAVGLSESLLYSFASKMKRSTRQGWTLGEIAEVLESKRVRRRKRPVSLQMVEEIRAGLICLGFRFEDRKFPLRGNSRSSPAANLRRSSRS